MSQPRIPEPLTAVVDEARTDPETVGLLVKGSWAAGTADSESDYDLVWVLTDEAYSRRRESSRPMRLKEQRDFGVLDIAFSSPSDLQQAAERPGWWSRGLATALPALDKTGEVAAAQRRLVRMSDEVAREQAAEWYDAYLNSFYRSLKCWRRGDELAGRIEAAESVMHLMRTLFSLERRHAPYPNGLRAELSVLEGQGWPPGYLEDRVRKLVTTGDPAVQQEIERRVEALVRDRGLGGIRDAWDGEIERVSRFSFEESST